MKRKIFLLAIIAILFLLGFIAGDRILNHRVESNLAALTVANNLYSTGQYEESIQILQQLLDQGVKDSAVFYNLGNAYYRLGDYGRAILNYKRAAQLSPRDSDIESNLELALTMAYVESTDIALGPVSLISDVTANWLSFNETVLLAMGLWLLITFLLITWRLLYPSGVPTIVRYAVLGALLLLLIVAVSLGSRTYTDSLESKAIVVDAVVTLRSEPDEEFASDFEIFGGSSVDLGERQGDWIYLSSPGDTYQGWVPAGSVETIALASSVSADPT